MTENVPDNALSTSGGQSLCDVCCWPHWGKLGQPSRGLKTLWIREFSRLSVSSGKGCPGCILFFNVWQYAQNEIHRDFGGLRFNTPGGWLGLTGFSRMGVISTWMEIFTLPGELS